jgi:putative ABC transport system permease protein
MLKTAWRNIRHQRLHSIINIGGLAVAMTAVILIMMWVQNELRFDTHHKDASRIHLVKTFWQVSKDETWIGENSPWPLHTAISQQLPEVEAVTVMQRSQQNELTLITGKSVFRIEWAAFTDRNWFNVFNYRFLEGNADNLFAHPYSVAVTESKAKQLFGKTAVIGETVLIDSTNYVVAAVLVDNPVNASFQFEVMIPIAVKLNTKARLDNASYWINSAYKTFVKLRAGADAEEASEKITALYKKNQPDQKITASLLSMPDLHFDNSFQWSAFKHSDRKTVNIFIALPVLLLLAAGINYVNLSVARAGLRTKEIGVRKIVGASRGHLFLQLMSESVLTSLLAMVFSMVLVTVCLPFYNHFTGIPFSFNPFEPHIAALIGGVLLSIILLTGIYPALLLSSFNPLRIFHGNNFIRLKDVLLRKGLMTVQFVFAVVMTIAAIVIYRQLNFIQEQPATYNRTQLFMLQSSIQQVSRTTTGSVVNNHWASHGNLSWPGKQDDFEPSYTDFSGDHNLQSIMNFQFARGQWFTENSNDDVILNETAVKQFGIPEPVIGIPFHKGKIVGVVKDFYYKSMHEQIGPVVIRLNKDAVGSLLVQAKPGNTPAAIEAARKIWEASFPGEPFAYTFMDEEFERIYREDRKALSFTMVFSGLSIFISCIGLLGLVTLAAAQRRKEIGIRKVLGASIGSIVALVSKDFMKLVVISILIASPLAWYAMNKWLEDFAYRIELQWWMFALAGLFAIVIAFFTLGFQSIKAALVNPAKSLRTE